MPYICDLYSTFLLSVDLGPQFADSEAHLPTAPRIKEMPIEYAPGAFLTLRIRENMLHLVQRPLKQM